MKMTRVFGRPRTRSALLSSGDHGRSSRRHLLAKTKTMNVHPATTNSSAPLLAPPAERTEPVAENLDPVGLWAFESRHSASFAMGLTRHRFVKLLLITQGSGTIQGDWGDRVCKTGDLVVVPAGLRHRIIDDPRHPMALYGLGIAAKLLRCVPGVTASLPSGVLRAEQLGPLRLEQRMRRLLYAHRQPDRVYRLAAVAAALDLVAQVLLAVQVAPSHGTPVERLARQPVERSSGLSGAATGEAAVGDDPMLESYLVWLQHNFFEPQSLDDAARACGMSRRHFTAAFRRRTGRTWLDYRNRLRAQHAIDLLQNTDRKMASIAFQSGFDDLSTFYRVIHRVAGLRPGQLRDAPQNRRL
jgi:AraC-like DNA-binding protein/mannose-6-phosphate isomerase-like protein (cupin superfamily)